MNESFLTTLSEDAAAVVMVYGNSKGEGPARRTSPA